MQIPSGEGERRAQRGYVPQYDLGARVIYEALATGQLRWIGVADRDAGSFDDIVLGLADRIVAYQVKTSRDPEPFSIGTLLLGANNLLGRLVEARRQIAKNSGDTNIETIYVCDDYPRTDDRVGDVDSEISSAAYLRAHAAHRYSWSISDWRKSPYGSFISAVQQRSGLNDSEFEQMWRNTQFRTSGLGRALGIEDSTAGDKKRIGEIAAILPQLVADSSDRDRWTVKQILDRLNWKDPFGLRHGHAFPVDALYESNEKTQRQLSEALGTITSGYISVVGPPGSGKSTLLAAGLLPTPRAQIMRYLAFVPGKGQGLGRGEAFDFLHDVIKQLKQHRLGTQIIPGSELTELREQLELLLREASERFRTEAIKTLIVIDGLDHVPREEKPEHSFLRQLPLPTAVPDGVIFVLGTQRLDLGDVPPSVVDQAGETGRYILIAPLTPVAVTRLAELAGVPDDVDRREIFNRTEGHPLSARYIIDGLLKAATAVERKEWLTSGPAFGGNVDIFYKRAWHDLDANAEAERGMAYLALAEGPISPACLDLVIGAKATDTLWKVAGHLLRRDAEGNWSIFHNSFRLFLRTQTLLRHGREDQEQLRRRYVELAEMAFKAENKDGQRWMELRYWARALHYDKVASLATPERFRNQFIEGRNPHDIKADITLSFQAAKALRDSKLVLDLILSSHEISMRTEALGDDVFRAFIDLGDLRSAKGILEAAALTVGKGFELVEAFLAAGRPDEARELFEDLEPIDKLLGSEPLQMRLDGDGLDEWAEQALAFREPQQILASLARLRAPDDPFHAEGDFDAYKGKLKLLAARGQLRRNPELNINDLIASLEIDRSDTAIALYIGTEAAFEAENNALTLNRLNACIQQIDDLSSEYKRNLARIGFAIDRADLCQLIMDKVEPPTVELRRYGYNDDDFRNASRQVVLHASLRSRLGLPPTAGKKPKSGLLAIYQSKLELLGNIRGESLAKHSYQVGWFDEFESFLDFLQRGEGEDRYDAERWHIDAAMDDVISVMVNTAARIGKETLLRFSELVDARLANSPGRIGRPRVRRAYAKAIYQHDKDTASAAKRIDYKAGDEETPAAAFSEAALTAQTLLFIGLKDEANSVLNQMHEEGLGYFRPAKKDPQYLLWEDFLVRANDEQPAGRPARLTFFARLLNGLAETEGAGAAQRVIGTLLQESARAGSTMGASVADLSEKCDLSSWSEIVEALAFGVVKEYPLLAVVSTVTIGRISIPFATGIDRDLLANLIRIAPSNQLETVVQKIVEALETDAPLESKVLALESVVEAAAKRGLNYGVEALKRWRGELPPPKSGNSPEDPFFLLRSLNEISTLLDKVRGTSDAYGARSAFLRVVSHANYDSAKTLFDKEDMLNTDEEIIETLAYLAIAKERRDDAEELLPILKRLAEERGSWGGGWSGQAKQRYFRLRLKLGDKNAAFEAFDTFVSDLANGRESCDYILPELSSLFSLISPTISWTVAWERLAAHLAQFREYKRGQEINSRHDICGEGEHTISDLLFRAIETTSSPLIQMARTAAVEIAGHENGAAVISALLPRLWRHGHYFALEAAQILWECRSLKALRACFENLVPLMVGSDDIAIQRVGMMVAEEWGLIISERHSDLPASYTLALPRDPKLDKFEVPSGMSSTSTGLFTEDVSTWTWVLKIPLLITNRASGIELSNLRHRVAQLMRKNGGANAFGPDAVKSQMSKLRRLSLHTSYWKLMSSAAFQAMREVLGELVAADSIDSWAVPFIAIESGAYSSIIRTLPPAPRPVGVPSVNLPEPFGSDDDLNWIEAIEDDLAPPQVEGFIVLAATAIHTRGLRDHSWRAEQYFGPSLEDEAQNLFEHIRRLPNVTVTDHIEKPSPRVSAREIVHPEPTIAGSIDTHTVMLCPLVAEKLGWRSDPNDAFTYLNQEGFRVAHTLYWRDGGISSRDIDTSIHRHGYMLLVRKDQLSYLVPYLTKHYEVRAWRRFRKSEHHNYTSRTARREELPPSP